jgi:hypothetical protein
VIAGFDFGDAVTRPSTLHLAEWDPRRGAVRRPPQAARPYTLIPGARRGRHRGLAEHHSANQGDYHKNRRRPEVVLTTHDQYLTSPPVNLLDPSRPARITKLARLVLSPATAGSATRIDSLASRALKAVNIPVVTDRCGPATA